MRYQSAEWARQLVGRRLSADTLYDLLLLGDTQIREYVIS